MIVFQLQIKRKLFLRQLLASVALLLHFLLLAQPQIESSRLLSYPEGLSDRVVRDITQDSRGFLWIATENGLNRYDGYRFQVFDSNIGSNFRIEENRLLKVRQVKNGKLAILNNRDQPFFELIDIHSFENQIVRLDGEVGIYGEVKAIYPVELGEIFVLSADSSAFHFFRMKRNGTFESTGSVTWPGFRMPEDVDFIVGNNGNFWISDPANGLTEVTGGGGLTRRFDMKYISAVSDSSAVPYPVSVLHEDKLGKLWVSFPFRQGIFTLSPGKDNLSRPEGLPNEEVYSGVWEDKKGQLLIGTFKSFGRLQNLYLREQNGQVTDYQPILDVDEKLTVVYGQDFKLRLFAGTYIGFNKINLVQRPIRWVLADRQLGDSDWDNGISIRNITGDGNGNIYIARELKAWYRLRLPSFEVDTIIPKNDAGVPVRLWCCSNLVYEKSGYLWGGSCASDLSGLLHRYEIKTGKTKTYETSQKVIRHMVASRNGGLWLLCGVEGGDGSLLYFDPKTEQFKTYFNADGSNPLDHLYPAYLLESRSGALWIGTEEGLVFIDLAKKESDIIRRGENSLTNDNILVIHESEDGRLWLGTYGGLNIFDPETGETEGYSLADGLCNNIVCGILPDGKGYFWLSTYSGLSFFDPDQKLFSNFFKDKGLTFNEFNRHAFYRDNQGYFYFGTLNGLNVFREEDLRKDDTPNFPIQLTKIVKTSVSGSVVTLERDLSAVKEIELSPAEMRIRLEFMLPKFGYAGRNNYAVWLEGVDQNWRFLGAQNFVEINRLPAGRYLLRIKAVEAKSFWGEQELRVTIVVKQVFYQTTWFQVSLPLFIVTMSYFLSRFVIKRIRKREKERTLINKKFAELELQALQSQMNPHFVFNSLGAIQYFIQNNRPEVADEYLTKFAKLIRLFLESSKIKYITLAEEIKLLSLYIELELMRFEDKFHAEIQVDDEIDVHSCEIPSVLIQPFVENAINHGLFHKNSKGKLLVRFSDEEDGAVTCIVEDNGIGRRRAQTLKENSSRHRHKSIGTQLVRERLEVLKQMDALNIQFEIEDVDDPETGQTGTRVIIKVPYLD